MSNDVNAISYAKAVEETARRNTEAGYPGNPVPDQPRGVEHLNPAINPAPAFEPKDRPPPVPVINDPGLVGAPISLATLNQAYREDDMARAGVTQKADDTDGLTEAKQTAAIRDASKKRLDEIDKKAKAEAAKAVAAARG